jgi:hypothetical protein
LGPFDDSVSNAAHVTQVLQWLALPEATRPSFITLYFSEVDHAGHRHGPDSPQVFEAARRVDDLLGQLVSGIRKLNLLDRPPIIGLADDGWTITTRTRHLLASAAGLTDGGAHGYDPRHRSMHGLFVAAGPRLRESMLVPAFETFTSTIFCASCSD